MQILVRPVGKLFITFSIMKEETEQKRAIFAAVYTVYFINNY